MTTKTKNPFKTTYHRDGSVTVWNVYAQQWDRRMATDFVADHSVMSSLSDTERNRIKKMAAA